LRGIATASWKMNSTGASSTTRMSRPSTWSGSNLVKPWWQTSSALITSRSSTSCPVMKPHKPAKSGSNAAKRQVSPPAC